MEPAPNHPEDFDKLRKLLALKRHEEPPPGYFDRLPGQVRTRIAQAQTRPEPFWRRWFAAFDFTPAMATGYATVTVLLLGAALWLARSTHPSGSSQLATTPPAVTNQNPALLASNQPPAGLFSPPTLQVQPASAPRR